MNEFHICLELQTVTGYKDPKSQGREIGKLKITWSPKKQWQFSHFCWYFNCCHLFEKQRDFLFQVSWWARMCTGRAGTVLSWDVTCDKSQVQMRGMRSVIDLLCMSLLISRSVLCWQLSCFCITWNYLLITPTLSFISQQHLTSWNSFSNQVSHFDFLLPFLVSWFLSLSPFLNSVLLFSTLVVHTICNICYLLNTYHMPGAFFNQFFKNLFF